MTCSPLARRARPRAATRRMSASCLEETASRTTLASDASASVHETSLAMSSS
ncbi:hypothetical protein D3C85_1882480 [compost metagenome]